MRSGSKRKKSDGLGVWCVKIGLLTFALSLIFSSLSEAVLSSGGIVVAIFIIAFFLIVQYITDIIGNAVTGCDDSCFNDLIGKGVKGAKEAAFLARNKDKVASFMCDIVGDVCGILSGSAGAAIVVKIVKDGSKISVLVAALVAAIIGALTVIGKAICKNYAKNNSKEITLSMGKFLTLFVREKRKRK